MSHQELTVSNALLSSKVWTLLGTLYKNHLRADRPDAYISKDDAQDHIDLLRACLHRLRHPEPLSDQEWSILRVLVSGLVVMPDQRANGPDYFYCGYSRSAMRSEPMLIAMARETSLLVAAILYQAECRLNFPRSMVLDLAVPILNKLAQDHFGLSQDPALRAVNLLDLGALFLLGRLDDFVREERDYLGPFLTAAYEHLWQEARESAAKGRGPSEVPPEEISECFSVFGLVLLSCISDSPVISHDLNSDWGKHPWGPP